jgi:hypothetical protein
MSLINNKGLIAGELFASINAALYVNGQIIDLSSTSVVNRPAEIYRFLGAIAINDSGAIVGSAEYGNEFGVIQRAYLLVPVKQK